jgi:hypothetical protein
LEDDFDSDTNNNQGNDGLVRWCASLSTPQIDPLKLISHTTHSDTGGFKILTTNVYKDNVNPCLSPCHVSKDITLPNEEPKLNVLEPALKPVACI